MTWKPHVTVAAVIKHQGKFLCVEEIIDEKRRLNQPAGHLEPGEDLIEAVIREVMEETRFDFTPEQIIGIYLWRPSNEGKTFLRVAFTGKLGIEYPLNKLDQDIDAITWLDESDIIGRQSEWRSPLVGRCIHDYQQGQRYPLDILTSLIER